MASWGSSAPRPDADVSVLVVDDDEGSRLCLAEALRLLGYRVVEAGDGGEALRHLAERVPDLVCTDLRMPGMDGTEFADVVRSLAPDVPLMVVSGCPPAELSAAAERVGAAAFLAKPFTLAELTETLTRVLTGWGEGSRPAAASREAAPAPPTLFAATVLQKTSQLSLLTQLAASLWSPRAGSDDVPSQAGTLLPRILDTVLRALPGERAAVVLTDGPGPQSVLWRGRDDLDLPVGQVAARLQEGGGHPQPWHGEFGRLSVVAAPLVIQGGVVGFLCVGRNGGAAPFTWSSADLLQAFCAHAAGALENASLGRRLADAFQETVAALICALEARHKYTEGHSLRVADYATATASALGMPAAACEQIRTAGLLHDLGKVGVRDAILDKPGRLGPEEWAAMRQHPLLGARILEPLGFLDQESRFVRYHHERLDGRGYPEGLRGSAIPLGARIIAVADAFDAMCSARSYRPAAPAGSAIERLRHASGSQFDLEVVEAFCRSDAFRPLPSA